ncbi:MAG: hypothetical protein KF770_26665 [Anaerolineae bacterium]|nr:hypothetical protein [Anaerolineae bacterium]
MRPTTIRILLGRGLLGLLGPVFQTVPHVSACHQPGFHSPLRHFSRGIVAWRTIRGMETYQIQEGAVLYYLTFTVIEWLPVFVAEEPCFSYDHLNRLTSAATNGVGSGQYTHTYAYNTLGNLWCGRCSTPRRICLPLTGPFPTGFGVAFGGCLVSCRCAWDKRPYQTKAGSLMPYHRCQKQPVPPTDRPGEWRVE